MASRRRRVIWALGAQEALNEALEFNAEESPDGARRVLHATLDLAVSLETLSERGRKVPEYDDPAIREIFVYSYRRRIPPWVARLRAMESPAAMNLVCSRAEKTVDLSAAPPRFAAAGYGQRWASR
jgi:hypothetical protein